MSPNTKYLIIDTTLRDGFQHEEHYFPLEERIQQLKLLTDAGVRDFEIGSFSHPGYLPQFKEIEKLVEMIPDDPNVEYTFLALNKRAVERAVAMKQKGARIDCVLTGQIATSVSYAKKNMNRTHEELFAEAEENVRMLHEGGIKKVRGNVGTVFGCPIEGEIPISRAVEYCGRMFDMGFDEIEHSDTAGLATPEIVSAYFEEIRKHWPDPAMHTLHIHDINGMGLACYYAAAKQGIVKFECALGGIGGQPANRIDGVPVHGTGEYYYENGRTGLVSTEDLAFMFNRMKFDCGIDDKKIVRAGKYLEKICGRKLDSFVVSSAPDEE